MYGPSATRVASRHLEAGVSDWLAWIVQPFAVLFRRSGEFVSGPVDDAMDNVIRELAPTIVHAIGEREVDEDVDEFVTGAVHGRHDARGGLYEDDDSSWSPDYRAGYHWGYANAATWTTSNLPNDVRSRVIRDNLAEFRGEVTEHVVEEALRKAWHAVDPRETVKAMVAAVKKHGWKVGIGLALFEVLEHTVLPAALIALTGRPEMAVTGTLPLGEILLPVILRAIGSVPPEANKADPDGHLDWYVENYGSVRLATSKEIRVVDPKDLVKGPSGMHTLRGTSFAPSNVNTPDEAWRWFKSLYAHGFPLRAKSLFQHPDGRYFEYHEFDTSG